ncbi:MAG TPA: hypothetical protein VFI59_02840 [Actinomycetota bacterium]|nr:hypothetical protein [Actinomycetota bacterium]
MKTPARCALVLTLTATLVVTLVGSASAGQIITYRGETSEAERVRLDVLKRDSGRRFLGEFLISFTVTCEDGSTGWLPGIGIGFWAERLRLGEGGEFQYDLRPQPGQPPSYSFHLAGTVRFGSAEGTFELNYASLTEDDQAQLCTTGVLDWAADRRRSNPARITGTSLPEGVTFLEIDRRGDLVELAAP